MSNQELWGEPPKKRKIRGSYEASDYAPPGSFGPREAGSVFAGTMQAQAFIMPAATAIEMLASSSVPTGAAFTASWFVQSAGFVAMKVIANMLRSYGASVFRDFGAWLWLRIVVAFRMLWPNIPPADGEGRPGIIERLFGWKKQRRRVIRRRRRRVI